MTGSSPRMRGSLGHRHAEAHEQGIIPAHAGLTCPAVASRLGHWDHPRACGAHSSALFFSPLPLGSSPRMRGSHRLGVRSRQCPGIIPAHAGLTNEEAAKYAADGDHPRACGAHEAKRLPGARWAGSSPRMRGSRRPNCAPMPEAGIIPAHAGLTRKSMPSSSRAGDHPRACGAHFERSCSLLPKMGSSPRMRGSLPCIQCGTLTEGIIPAHAGLTPSRAASGCPPRDHPRACGAHASCSVVSTRTPGSSPRMRGSQEVSMLAVRPVGIIPAHAGLTRYAAARLLAARDHPRACGAHSSGVGGSDGSLGSSPRMRGSRLCAILSCRLSGIIPAHAGLTCRHMRCMRTTRDHPRACGAHKNRSSVSGIAAGSSPRMRGSHCVFHFNLPFFGIIPAHAGLTLKNPNIDAILSGPHPIFYSVLRVIR